MLNSLYSTPKRSNLLLIVIYNFLSNFCNVCGTSMISALVVGRDVHAEILFHRGSLHPNGISLINKLFSPLGIWQWQWHFCVKILDQQIVIIKPPLSGNSMNTTVKVTDIKIPTLMWQLNFETVCIESRLLDRLTRYLALRSSCATVPNSIIIIIIITNVNVRTESFCHRPHLAHYSIFQIVNSVYLRDTVCYYF